jgi:hypothetical protein
VNDAERLDDQISAILIASDLIVTYGVNDCLMKHLTVVYPLDGRHV